MLHTASEAEDAEPGEPTQIFTGSQSRTSKVLGVDLEFKQTGRFAAVRGAGFIGSRLAREGLVGSGASGSAGGGRESNDRKSRMDRSPTREAPQSRSLALVSLPRNVTRGRFHRCEALILSVLSNGAREARRMAQNHRGAAVSSPASTKRVHSTAAERMRRHRQRRSRNLRCLMVELREREIDALIHRAGLPPGDRPDHATIRKALYGFFDAHLR